MCHVRGVAVALLSAALVTEAYLVDAAASVVNVDEFAVARNGTTIFDDSFNRDITLNGGSGSVIPSGTTFSDGTAASYFVQGSIPETTANNGQAQLNAANGILRVQPPPQIQLIQIVNGGLQTGTDPGGPQTLTPANTFSAIGLFDAAVPSVCLHGRGLRTQREAGARAACVAVAVPVGLRRGRVHREPDEDRAADAGYQARPVVGPQAEPVAVRHGSHGRARAAVQLHFLVAPGTPEPWPHPALSRPVAMRPGFWVKRSWGDVTGPLAAARGTAARRRSGRWCGVR
jgi:hypothetical protein